MSEIEGVCPIIVVPFTDQGAIDFDSFRKQIRTLAEGGCHAQILFGFASEFYKLSDGERKELIETAVEVGREMDCQIWASVTEQSTPVAVEWAQYFEDVGVDGLMLLPPYTGETDKESLLRHMEAVADGVDVPILIQYAPNEVETTISPDTFVELYNRVDNVTSYKIECNPPGPYMTELLERTDGEIDLLVGNAGHQFIEAMDRGAVGVMPGGGMSDYYLDIYQSYQDGDRKRAIELHNEILPMLNHITQSGQLFIHYEKQIMKRRGMLATDLCREPTVAPDAYFDGLVDEYYTMLEDRLD
ncbi:hypothetical protein C5C07_17260 [Haloferax sp. Atlit-4N]|uniref:dihydrodipicolinate synthase family protein n=1 Tax=Haloferax sp. Atlit-4N TaxID=2077206 RepID=UPI000E23EB2A|nr:dihydrodipicolinate synthase family protein [Haloferax sp. Atlit-4N]RDZ51336.1 hypothetical protein C5C07_17260 [Haloferax sp. Atlit-4N]